MTFSSHPMPNPSGKAVNSPFEVYPKFTWGFLGGAVVKNMPANAGEPRDAGSKKKKEMQVQSLGPWRRKWQTTPVLLPGKFRGQRRLVGYSSWGHNEWDMT